MSRSYKKTTEDFLVSDAVASNFNFLVSAWDFEKGRSEYGVFFDHFEWIGNFFNLELHVEKRERQVDLTVASRDTSKPLTTIGVFEGNRVRKYLGLWLRDQGVDSKEYYSILKDVLQTPATQQDASYLIRKIEIEAKALSRVMPKLVEVAQRLSDPFPKSASSADFFK